MIHVKNYKMKLISKQFSVKKKKEKDESTGDLLSATGLGLGTVFGAHAIKEYLKSKSHEKQALKYGEAFKELGGTAPWIDTTKKANQDRIKILSKNKMKDIRDMLDESRTGNRMNQDWAMNVVNNTRYRTKEDADNVTRGLSAILTSGKAKENQLSSALLKKSSRRLRNTALAVSIPSASYLAYKAYKNRKKKNKREND